MENIENYNIINEEKKEETWVSRIVNITPNVIHEFITDGVINTLILRAYNTLNPVFVSLTPVVGDTIFEVRIPAGGQGLISRPFPIKHFYLFTTTEATVSISEIFSNNPLELYVMGNFGR